MDIQSEGALAFGAVIGWVTYYTMRYKKEHAITDIATVVGALGGAAVLALFPAKSTLFGWYAVGLAIGFFVYVLILLGIAAAHGKLSALVDPEKNQNPFMGGGS